MGVVCLLTTTLALISSFGSKDHIDQSEECMLAMVVSYWLVSSTYVAGMLFGDDIACVERGGGVSEKGRTRVEAQGTGNEYCTFNFILLFYFSSAIQVWWVLLVSCWFLSTTTTLTTTIGFSMGRPKRQHLHLLAWSLPALQTLGVLVWGAVEGESVVGVCRVSLSRPIPFKLLLLFPMGVYLLLGGVVFFATLFKLHFLRRRSRKQGLCTLALERLAIRMAIFALLFGVPVVVMLTCHALELTNRNAQVVAWYLDNFPTPHHPHFPLNILGNHQSLSSLLNHPLNLHPPNLHPQALFHDSMSPQHPPPNLSTHPFFFPPPNNNNISVFKHLIFLLPAIFISAWLCLHEASSCDVIKRAVVNLCGGGGGGSCSGCCGCLGGGGGGGGGGSGGGGSSSCNGGSGGDGGGYCRDCVANGNTAGCCGYKHGCHGNNGDVLNLVATNNNNHNVEYPLNNVQHHPHPFSTTPTVF